MNNAPRRLAAIGCSLLLLALPGCGGAPDPGTPGPVTITIAYTGVDAARDYLMHLKEKFPHINLQLMSSENTSAAVREEDGLLEYLAEHHAVADITISNALGRELPFLAEAFADLSGKDYSARYQTSYLNDAEIDGAVYYFPFYLTVKGLICNRTLFDEKGWKLPGSYEEFAALLRTIHADPDGITPVYDENAVDTVAYWMSVYYSLNEGALLSGYEALRAFNRGGPAAGLELTHTLAYMSLLAETGCLSEESLYAAEEIEGGVQKGFYSLGRRETAMAFGSGTTWTVLKKRGFTDEFVVTPLYTPDCPEGYVLEQQTLNIGVGKAAMDDPRKEAVIDELMRYISSEEGQQKLLELSSGIKSPCYGIMDAESRKFMEGILPALQKGYIVQLADFRAVDSSFDRVLVEYLFHNEDGSLSEREVLAALARAADTRRTAAQDEERPLAEVTQDFTYEQTQYLLLAAMADAAGADFAVLPQTQRSNYYGMANRSETLRSGIFAGTLSAKNIRSLLLWDTPLKAYRVTGGQLLKLMDYNTAVLTLYGARMEYAYDRERETYRTAGASLPDGSEVDPAAAYTLVTSDSVSVPRELEPLELERGPLLSDALIGYCGARGSLSPPKIPEPHYIN